MQRRVSISLLLLLCLVFAQTTLAVCGVQCSLQQHHGHMHAMPGMANVAMPGCHAQSHAAANRPAVQTACATPCSHQELLATEASRNVSMQYQAVAAPTTMPMVHAQAITLALQGTAWHRPRPPKRLLDPRLRSVLHLRV